MGGCALLPFWKIWKFISQQLSWSGIFPNLWYDRNCIRIQQKPYLTRKIKDCTHYWGMMFVSLFMQSWDFICVHGWVCMCTVFVYGFATCFHLTAPEKESLKSRGTAQALICSGDSVRWSGKMLYGVFTLNTATGHAHIRSWPLLGYALMLTN